MNSNAAEHLIFYEKPGCVGNARQKALLRRLGIGFEARNLLATSWRPDTLRPYFGDLPVRDWFNTTAPRVKSGEIDVTRCTEEEALALMVDDPILIRRPLLRLAALRQAGFETGPVTRALELPLDEAAGLQICPDERQSRLCGGAG